MGWRDRVGDATDALSAIRNLMIGGRMAAALRAAETAVAGSTNPYLRAHSHVLRITALVNLGRTAQYTAAVDEAFAALRELPEPQLHGHLHAVAALASRQLGAPERSLTHLVHAARALGVATGDDPDLAWGWHDLAMAYSYLGFHPHSLSAIERARQLGVPKGIPAEHFAQPGIRLRMALSIDHNGDTDGCLRVLRDLSTELEGYARQRLRPSDRVSYGYAIARQAALDAPTGADPRPLLSAGAEGQRARDMRMLGEVCLLVSAGKATDALSRLDAVTVSQETLGPAEPARLRSLAFSAAGDHPAAHQADRYAFRIAAQRTDRLRDVFLEGIAARLDHEDVRRSVANRDQGSLTDPLTGLANRLYLDRYLAAMVGRGERAMVGTVDLDGLASVNDRHGRLSGDLVLQRVAGVIARVLRSGDFVARFGSDEFAVVLPNASADQAQQVARRIGDAVGAEDWANLVPGSTIGVTVRWAST
ncbi:GGDEF domain-containing protein [Natronosporangium hydrolyticum]|uniref:GGDEF domain-containing protein n=1 Tax=Natronosporangium hydrolyticum TaxID=2811111 RepID=A0A895YDJ0_9ACTN|nr:GGDEF domain-containing protein [Natronosporangium hydrolyticum]QSB15847.1 GGDEF domain-containing protein [Natronosporangium hydrolyticum]